MNLIHPSADVENGASVGDGTRIWHLSHIRSGASIGSGCTLGRNVFVDSGAVVGNGCKVQNNVSVYNGVTLEDAVFVGPSVVFTNDHNPRATGEWAVSPTLIRQDASIGAGAVLVCGITVGQGAMVGAGAVVTKDVPDWALVVGNPARRTGWVCVHGQRTSQPDGRCEENRMGGAER